MRNEKRVVRPDDRPLATPQTAHEGTDGMSRSQQVRDPDFARAAQQSEANLERAKEEALAWKEILTSAVKAKREGDFSKDLKDKDVKAVIEAAQIAP